MKKSKISLMLVLASSFLLGSCGQNDDINSKDNLNLKDEITLLKKGFDVAGKLDIKKEYFKDVHHFRPSSLIEDELVTIDFKLIYEDSADYIGSDRRFYKTKDGKRRFLLGENIFNDAGYVGMNYVDYENTVRRDGYASDDNGNSIPYSVSGYINPFKLIKPTDFYKQDSKISLIEPKASILLTTMLGELDDLEENIVVSENEFNFEKDTLKSAKIKTKPLSGITSVKVDGQYKNVYSTISYDLDLNFSNVGTADAYNAIKEEPAKPENSAIDAAISKFEDGNYTVRRHLKAFDLTNNEYVQEEQCIDIFYSSNEHAIYQSIYDYNLNKKETGAEHALAPSESDLLFYDNNDNDLLNTFTLKVIDEKPVFVSGAPYYPSIEELFTYESLLLCYTPVDDINYGFVNVSGDVFNKNDDGSYSPIDDNIPYMANDCFVSQLQTTEEIAAGFITEFKLFLKDEATDPTIDKIQLQAEFGPFVHNITLTYEDFGTTVIPFDAFAKMQEEVK